MPYSLYLKTSLPPELLLMIREILIASKQKRSGAKLVQCSRGFYRFFSPVLGYEELELVGGCQGLFSGMMGLSRSSEKQTTSRRAVSCIGNSARFAFPTILTHLRKIHLLKRCTRLTIHDISTIETLLEAHEAAGEGARLFDNVRQLSLRQELIWSLPFSGGFLKRLEEVVRPDHICVWLGVGDREAWAAKYRRMRRCTWSWGRSARSVQMVHEDDDDDQSFPATSQPVGSQSEERLEEEQDEWTWYTYNNVSTALEILLNAFQPKRITIHNLTVQRIPAVYANPYRVFFSPSPPDEAASDIPTLASIDSSDTFDPNVSTANGSTTSASTTTSLLTSTPDIGHRYGCSLHRALDISDTISCVNPRTERFEFVDVDHCGCERGVTGGVEKTVSEITTVGRESMRFLKREDVMGCECCGGK
ncbi:hypothetical protein IAR55_002837 [Kwoniella newhampshirensis]|uniref:F-box domain-containing protein n=1 Tax=Kwoniella newhampshirensis TaxID=1651941 RepID=A0AAW0YZY0_9TREE